MCVGMDAGISIDLGMAGYAHVPGGLMKAHVCVWMDTQVPGGWTVMSVHMDLQAYRCVCAQGHIGPQALYECACMCVCVCGYRCAHGPGPLYLCLCNSEGHAHMCVHGFMCGCGPGSGNVCRVTPQGPGTAHTQVFRYAPELGS